MRMEYGVVEFKTDNGCSYITSFRTDNDEYRSINGCYGIDGEYITTTKNGNVYFIYSLLLAVIVLFNHRSNIKRILNGTENKIGSKK